MSSSIAIPKRKQPMTALLRDSSPSSLSSSSSSPQQAASPSVSSSYSSSPSSLPSNYGRRVSWLSDSIARTEHTVIDIGGPDAPRLITCVKSSQGFDWNTELFLPSYLERGHAAELERKKDPITDIVLTDEEAAALLPQ